jgi:glucosyl-3-phosphoglycerate synthase
LLLQRDEWFRKRTFHHLDYADIKGLVASKEDRGLTYSVCLPTKNVASTIGGIVRMFRSELMEKFPLIDQLAIIDSRSDDGTPEIASREGAEVYFDDEILPDAGPGSGKGEALWKSLAVLSGDLIAWVDSDIENIHPRFAYGLVGPLLEEEDVVYVKGFYLRPLTQGEVRRDTGGGRVTELVVRPMLNLFYPDLAGFMQPLSGEYAGRREVLRSIPFLTGYGVETGLLLELFGRHGLESLAQVDLEVREHFNQALPALSRMAFAVLQAAFLRLSEDGKVELLEELRTVYNSIEMQDGEYKLKPMDLEVVVRPPMDSVAGGGVSSEGV